MDRIPLSREAPGRRWLLSGTRSKALSREHLLRFVPFAARNVLEERGSRSAPRARFCSELEDHLSSQDADKTLQTIIRWGRYAEVFDYDDVARVFSASPATT